MDAKKSTIQKLIISIYKVIFDTYNDRIELTKEEWEDAERNIAKIESVATESDFSEDQLSIIEEFLGQAVFMLNVYLKNNAREIPGADYEELIFLKECIDVSMDAKFDLIKNNPNIDFEEFCKEVVRQCDEPGYEYVSEYVKYIYDTYI